MNKFKLFIENFFIYGLGGIISKIVPLLMVPIVTRIMPSTDYYGISDLSNTVVQFGSALAVMGMYDAMYRMFFEKEDDEYKKTVCSTALIFTLFTSFAIFILMLIIKDIIAQFFFNNLRYAYVVYLSAIATLVGATNSIVSAPTRMQNKRTIFLVTNLIGSVLSYLVSIPLLMAGYYVIALPLASAVSGIMIEIVFCVINKEWFKINKFDFKILKQLLVIAVPLLPNFLIYWIFNSCDKVMITKMIGISEEGIYSVGAKLGQCSQLIYTAFAGGWQFFAFSTMKEENQVKSNSIVFEYLGVISFVASMFVCAWSHPLFAVLFPKQYLGGYIVAPYLFLAPLLQMLFQVACNQFIVIKKTWPNMLILLAGAVINLLLNYYLIPILGIEGAAVATLIGYVVSNLICVMVLIQMKLMIISIRFIIVVIIMSIYMICWRFFIDERYIIGTTVTIFIVVFYLFLYRQDISNVCRMLINKRKNDIDT